MKKMRRQHLLFLVGSIIKTKGVHSRWWKTSPPKEGDRADHRELYWFVDINERGHIACRYGDDYPSYYTGDESYADFFLFESDEDCCRTLPKGCHDTKEGEEESKDVAVSPVASGAAGNNAAAASDDVRRGNKEEVKCLYRMSTSQPRVCTNRNDVWYPEEWARPKHRPVFFFSTSEECCDMFYSNGDCTVQSSAECHDSKEESAKTTSATSSSGTTAEEAEETPVGPASSPEDDPSGAEGTGTRNLSGASSAELARRAVAAPPPAPPSASPASPSAREASFVLNDEGFIELDGGTSRVSFEGGDNSSVSILANSPGWETTTLASYYDGGRSMTNSETGRDSQLTVKIKAPRRSRLTCMAKISVSRPYERLVLLLDGKVQASYETESGEGWKRIKMSAWSPGEHVYGFRIQGSDFYRRRAEGEVSSGSTAGHVFLDVCEIEVH